MNKKVLKTLEYDKIIDMLVEEADSALGKDSARRLRPSSDHGEIVAMQAETSHALTRLFHHGALSFHGLTDIRPSLVPLAKGGTLGAGELLRIGALLEAAKRAVEFDKKDEETDFLSGRFDGLQTFPEIRREISRCILSEDEISDDASSELKRIRRAMKTTNDKIREQLSVTVNSSGDMLRDNIVTMRNGRYCLPVKQEYKSAFQGMIHDQSSTGSTFFIEPMAIVKLNNDLAELAMKEQEEIERILASISSICAPETEGLERDVILLSELDFIFAKAKLSKKMQGSEPIFDDNYIEIKKGRHPLIPRDRVVPIDVTLGKDYRLLIITGPNTGGKTVSLKTVGLFTLMGQAGLHIPAFDGSHLRVFHEVYADIGDEQSIEQSLSTFSSHMTNIVSFWEQADERSLVLFDELGAGTDPTEGAALAMAILSNLHRRDIRTIATTHYSELKVFALSTPGVENGCCEFSVETLRPTYRLLIGVPGKSNAFAISEKIGLPDYVIEEAKTYLSKEDESFEDVISDLEQSRVLIEREREETNRYREEAEELQKRLSRKEDRLESSRDEILRKAREEAQALLREAKEYADESIRKYNKLGNASGSAKEMEKERTKLREKMASLQKDNAVKTDKKPKKALQAKDLRLGDSVKVLSMNLRGTVSTLPDAKGNLFVQMGILRSQVNLRDLEKLDDDLPAYASKKSPATKGTGSGKIKMSKSASISSELNLLGMTTDEAIVELDKYLDDAYLAHLSPVRIVHGKGTGALRKAVHQFLRRQKHVDTYRLGEYGEGDAGVTIVTFK